MEGDRLAHDRVRSSNAAQYCPIVFFLPLDRNRQLHCCIGRRRRCYARRTQQARPTRTRCVMHATRFRAELALEIWEPDPLFPTVMLTPAPFRRRLMDRQSNGRLLSPQPGRLAALSLMSATLLACAPSPARSDLNQEDRMQGTQAHNDVRTEQNRVAAMHDDLVRELGGEAVHPVDASASLQLPSGPAMTAAGLESGIVSLIASVAGPDQTQPDFVGGVFGVELLPDATGERVGVQGRLEEGAYEIYVSELYPSSPGKHVSIRVRPLDSTRCLFAYEVLNKALTDAGYSGKPMPRSLDPGARFSRGMGAIKSFVRLDTDRHDSPRCVRHVSLNLEQVVG